MRSLSGYDYSLTKESRIGTMGTVSRNYYGTITTLAWALRHYFYGSKHFVFLAGEYFPYRLRNPKSSNPHLVYQDIYQPWKDRDDYDKVINQLRLGITAGVIKKHTDGVIDADTAQRLKRICEEVDITFLYPVVCRVNTGKIEKPRLELAGSGLEGSSEYLIRDLDELELDEMLFLDFDSDDDFNRIISAEYFAFRQDQAYEISPSEALSTLERRCSKGGIRQPVSSPNS